MNSKALVVTKHWSSARPVLIFVTPDPMPHSQRKPRPLHQETLNSAKNCFCSFHFSLINIPEEIKGNLQGSNPPVK